MILHRSIYFNGVSAFDSPSSCKQIGNFPKSTKQNLLVQTSSQMFRKSMSRLSYNLYLQHVRFQIGGLIGPVDEVGSRSSSPLSLQKLEQPIHRSSLVSEYSTTKHLSVLCSLGGFQHPDTPYSQEDGPPSRPFYHPDVSTQPAESQSGPTQL